MRRKQRRGRVRRRNMRRIKRPRRGVRIREREIGEKYGEKKTTKRKTGGRER